MMSEQRGQGPRGTGCLRAFIFLLIVFCLLASASAYLISRRQAELNNSGIRLEQASTELSYIRRLLLQSYLAEHAAELAAPAGTASDVQFEIRPGAAADRVAADLAATGLLDDPELFLNYLQFYGRDAQLRAGQFTLSGELSIPQLAEALTLGSALNVTVSFLPGMRMEEMAAYLDQISSAQIEGDEFLDIARRRRRLDLGSFSFLNSLGADMTLEGFLFPATYSVPYNADAEYLIEEMLRMFDRQVTPAMRQAYGGQGLSLPQAVILASIIARETPFDEERQRIASVYLNRVHDGMPLQADPTVQYAVGYQADTRNWWKAPLTLNDLNVDHAYNTYVVDGLPPGPIANPGLASLQAVASPESTEYLFFVVDCESTPPGRHVFSRTYEEHLANVERCR